MEEVIAKLNLEPEVVGAGTITQPDGTVVNFTFGFVPTSQQQMKGESNADTLDGSA